MNHTTIPHQRLRGEIVVAPDKSISHRSLILGAIAQGESHIKNLLLGEDVLRTLTIINQLGIKTSHDATTITQGDELTIFGNGLSGLQKPNDDLYCGNSGTTMRLMLGLLSGQSFSATLTGDESLDQRPMDRVLEPLRQMGAAFEVEHRDGKRFIKTLPRPDAVVPFLKGLEYVMPVASAQVKTGIALAGLYAAGEVIIKEPFPSRNHTELMMKSMRVRIKAKDREVCLNQVGKLKPLNLIIPGDLSSAAFFIAAALLAQDADLIINHVNLNPTRAGFLDVLKFMGAKITTGVVDTVQGEAVGWVRAQSSRLKNISIGGNLVPRLIDELPVLALVAACSEGKMLVKDAGELRVKETDRIRAICSQLPKLGVNIEEREDGFLIQGNPAGIRVVDQMTLNTFGDHRLAMMEAVAGLVADKSFVIDDVKNVDTSFPGFFNLLDKIRG